MSSENLRKVLVAEDNVHFVKYLQDNLASHYDLDFAGTGETMMEKFQNGGHDLVILDLGLPRRPGMHAELLGFELIKRIKTLDPLMEVIVLTGTAREIESAIRAIKDGAYHFLIKDDFEVFDEKLRTCMQNAIEKRNLTRSNRTLLKREKYFAESQKRVHKHQHPELNYHFGILLGECAVMQEIYTIIEKVSARQPNETVLIQGENGTGKELVALSIHAQSPRGERPWIVANIATLPPQLVESELFGIEARTATGVGERVGYFEQADGSSLFLDEVGEVPGEVQVKLLRVLQQKQIQRVGSSKANEVDVRIITATNRNLKEMVAQGKFREDLYFRLDVISISLPPLRERRDDIPILIKHIVHGIRQEEQNPNLALAPDAIELLQEYHWPGNVRQLENVIKKATVLRNEDILHTADFLNLLHDFGRVAASNGNVLERLPSLQEIAHNRETGSFTNIGDEKTRHKILLRTLIESEGRMEEVLERLQIARNTAYRYLDEVQNLLLAGLCVSDVKLERMASGWQVDAEKLEKAVHRANRLPSYFQGLQKRFANDRRRLAVFLNVKVEQLERLDPFLAGMK